VGPVVDLLGRRGRERSSHRREPIHESRHHAVHSPGSHTEHRPVDSGGGNVGPDDLSSSGRLDLPGCRIVLVLTHGVPPHSFDVDPLDIKCLDIKGPSWRTIGKRYLDVKMFDVKSLDIERQ
jgi:hypothetical protein